jgi:hypothetical protein
VGTEATVDGTGFDAGERIDLYAESTEGTPLASTTADEEGNFTGTVVIPDAAEGYLLIAAKGQSSGLTASKSFNVTEGGEDESVSPPVESDPPASDTSGEEAVEPTAVPTEEPTPEPTPEPVPRELVFVPVSDTSVSAADPDVPQAPDDAGTLAAGGPDGAVAFITFQVEGIAEGTVVSAQLVLTDTGETGGVAGAIRALDGVWADEGSWTFSNAPVRDGRAAIGADGSVAAPWLDPWAETVVDVTGSVNGDGTITFVVRGTSDATLWLGSRESAASARLVVTVLDGATQG